MIFHMVFGAEDLLLASDFLYILMNKKNTSKLKFQVRDI